jgi:hypothetical protein
MLTTRLRNFDPDIIIYDILYVLLFPEFINECLFRSARPMPQFKIIFTILICLYFTRAHAADSISNTVQQRGTSISPAAPLKNSADIPTDFEERLGQFYANDDCEKINQSVPKEFYSKLRPFVLAVLASCEPPSVDIKKLFEEARSKDPNNELILLLYGRYLWRTDQPSSIPIWQSLKFRARTKAIGQLASDYLSGDAEEVIPRTLNSSTSFLLLQAGSSYETDPSSLPISSPEGVASRPSSALNLQGIFNLQKNKGWGSLGGTYALTSNTYSSLSTVNLVEHDFEFPVTFLLNANSDFALRPFTSLINLSGSPYFNLYGVGLLYYFTQPEFKQYFQLAIFSDHFTDSLNQPQGGQHYRLEYRLDRFQSRYFTALMLFKETVEAGIDYLSVNAQGVSYSHDDEGAQLFFDHEVVKGSSFGFYPRVTYRRDRDPSQFNSPTAGSGRVNRREDLITSMQINFSYDLPQGFSIFSWYQYDQSFSTMAADSYLDRNSINQTSGVALRYSRATF